MFVYSSELMLVAKIGILMSTGAVGKLLPTSRHNSPVLWNLIPTVRFYRRVGNVSRTVHRLGFY
jgi:hypothetical protein